MATPDGGQTAMELLDRQWYNTVVAGLGLEASTFQLLRPTSPLGNKSDSLWGYFNNIPPLSLTNNFANAGGNRFYDDYRGVIAQLEAPGLAAFNNILGDAEEAWYSYLEKITPEPDPKALPEIFIKWATVHGHAGIAAKGASALASLANNAIYLAQLAVADQKGFINHVPTFSVTIEALKDAIQKAESRPILFDSHTAVADASNTWAKGRVSGIVNFFNAGGSGSFSEASAKAATSQTILKARFQHVMTLRADPGPWYSSAALNVAYSKSDNYTWRAGSPDWEDTFGPKGNMLRFTTSLIIVNGIDMTMESSATFSSAQQKEIEAHASAGFWPFFSAHVAGGFSTAAEFTSDGKMIVKSANPAGNPMVFGANVMPVGSFVKSQSPSQV